MKKYFDVLKKSSLFEGMNVENISAMLGCLGAKVQAFAKNETVFSEGDPAKYLGIVLSGQIRIERTDYFGNRSIVSHISASELFGESFACAGEKKLPVDVVAAADSEIMLIDCERIISQCSNVCDFHNRIIYNLLKTVARKNLIYNRKSRIVSQRTTREKLMTFLFITAKEKNTDSFEIPYDRQALADYLEVDRSGLSAEIGKLCKEGILECRKNSFTLLREKW